MRGRLRIGASNLRAVKLCILFAFLGAQFPAPQASSPARTAEGNCVKCHAQSTGRAEEVVRLHLSSAHGRAGGDCNDCHGGDPTQTDKTKAHSSNFTGKPDRSATLTMCGACHAPQFAQFKTGKHFQEKQGTPRLDCAECHGAHSVGNQPETFSLGQFCVSCHGLEYLPPLPQEFQDLLNLSDDLRDAFAQLAKKGRKPSEEAIDRRKEIRRLTAEIVHPTDLNGGLTRIPHIVSRGEKLKQQIK
jgi:nitrate/TMAO reductase-like tetraheme cytochrome c subunit